MTSETGAERRSDPDAGQVVEDATWWEDDAVAGKTGGGKPAGPPISGAMEP